VSVLDLPELRISLLRPAPPDLELLSCETLVCSILQSSANTLLGLLVVLGKSSVMIYRLHQPLDLRVFVGLQC
jgi:hypothetical protein